MGEIKIIHIATEYITLGQFLKFADIIHEGGEAKSFLASNLVLVDGVEENRRGRKLRPGNQISVGGRKFEIA